MHLADEILQFRVSFSDLISLEDWISLYKRARLLDKKVLKLTCDKTLKIPLKIRISWKYSLKITYWQKVHEHKLHVWLKLWIFLVDMIELIFLKKKRKRKYTFIVHQGLTKFCEEIIQIFFRQITFWKFYTAECNTEKIWCNFNDF